jgi:MoaA/NifB/PqqE/SkfB family radical SAM enzyme
MRRQRIPLPLALGGSFVTAPALVRVKPAANRFMLRYLRSFPVRSVGGKWIVHSHLPPLNSAAYARFVQLHLVDRVPGPSHAQIGLTNACPQDCLYCYNKQRRGRRMDTNTILQVIDDLRAMGVVWLGFTGGEPLLNRDLLRITEHAADGCAVKLFTSGCGLTPQLAADLAAAGLFSACVSLDHWDPAVHDANRRYDGAFATALQAIEMLKDTGQLHVAVSSVFSREMIVAGQVEPFLGFLEGLGVDEAWVSEVKPSVEAFWTAAQVVTDDERRALCELQDRWNRRRRGSMTVNYLGHFESGEAFGCNAGAKMVYVDAFGEVSPCVFTPLTFGNVQDRLIGDLVAEMRSHFHPQDRCWINANFRELQAEAGGDRMLDRQRTIAAVARCTAAPRPAFDRVLYG